ncbi:MAG: LysR family transcriptional regulator, partial [Desulfobacterales bacterium]|nr:LysR family transcriptional regulator [Desulfobacterales bacterium]
LKTPLFIRQHRKIIPTQAGQRLFKMVAPFIRELNQTLSLIARPGQTPWGLLRIGSPVEFGKKYLPTICQSFREKYENVSFHLSLTEPRALLEMLGKGELDVALVDYFPDQDTFPGINKQYRMEPLVEENLVLACSRRYYNTRVQGNYSQEHLRTLEFISDEHEHVILKHWFRHFFKRTVSDLNIVMTIESHQGLLNCIRQGMGLAITVDHLLEKEIRNKSVIPIFPDPRRLINQISLVQLTDKEITLTEKCFLNHFKKEILRQTGLNTISKE